MLSNALTLLFAVAVVWAVSGFLQRLGRRYNLSRAVRPPSSGGTRERSAGGAPARDETTTNGRLYPPPRLEGRATWRRKP